jgi:hypothetical protein
MFKAIKEFEIEGATFKIGDTVPSEIAEGRLERAKKVQKVKDETKVEAKKEVNAEAKSPKKSKKEKKAKTELLTEDGSEVTIEVE